LTQSFIELKDVDVLSSDQSRTKDSLVIRCNLNFESFVKINSLDSSSLEWGVVLVEFPSENSQPIVSAYSLRTIRVEDNGGYFWYGEIDSSSCDDMCIVDSTYCVNVDSCSDGSLLISKIDDHYISNLTIDTLSLNDFYVRTWVMAFAYLRFTDQKQVIRHIPGERSPSVSLFTTDYDLFLSLYEIDTSKVNWIQFSSVDSIKNELIGKFSLNLVFESGYTHLPERLIFENCTFKSKFLN